MVHRWQGLQAILVSSLGSASRFGLSLEHLASEVTTRPIWHYTNVVVVLVIIIIIIC